MKKSLAALALAGSISLLGAVPAVADNHTYPAPPSNGSVSRGTVAPGQTFTATLRGFQPFERVTIARTLRTTRPQAFGGSFSGGASMAVPAKIILPQALETITATADAEGTVVISLSLDEAGDYTITATGESGRTVTTSVTVDPDAAEEPTNNDGNDDGADTGNGNSNSGTDTGTGTGTNNTGTITIDGSGTTNGEGGAGASEAPKDNKVDVTAASSGLANTGADTNLVLWSLVGAGALAAGIGSVVVVRRRAKADASA